MEAWRKSGGVAELSKWMGLVAAIWVQAFAGNTFAYANYSATLKSVLELNQVQLNYLALSKDVGENVGILAGLLYNRVPPWVILSMAALQGFLGFGFLWLVASRTINTRPLWQMSLAIFVGGNSMTWFNTAVLVTCMRNFPNTRGTIVGFLKGFIGLSGAIFTQIFKSLLGSDAVSLLFFLAVGPTLVCLCCMGFIRPVQPSPTSGRSYHELEEQRQFQFIYIVCIALAIYLLVAVFLDELITSSLVLHIIVALMFLFLLTPIFVPLRVLIEGLVFKKKAEMDVKEAFLSSVDPLFQPLKTPDEKGDLGGDKGDVIERALEGEEKLSKRGPEVFEADEEDADALLALGEGAVRRKKRRPRRGEDFKLRQALIKADFWLLFFIFFCGVGTAITATNNLSQLGQAQGYSQVSTFVMLSSIWGFLGRLGGGSVSEHFIRSSTTPRPVWIAAAQALLIVAHLLFALAPRGSLYLASSIMGLCYGIQIAVIVPTASEIFGLKHFGKLYNFITLADPMASLLFSTLLAGNLYDLEVMRQYSVPLREASNLVCTGARCFRLAFLVMAGVCVVGVGLCIILSIRLKPVYKTLYGVPDSASASYSTLSSSASYNSFPSGYVAASSSPLPVSFTFPHVLSSLSLPQECNDEDLR